MEEVSSGSPFKIFLRISQCLESRSQILRTYFLYREHLFRQQPTHLKNAKQDVFQLMNADGTALKILTRLAPCFKIVQP